MNRSPSRGRILLAGMVLATSASVVMASLGQKPLTRPVPGSSDAAPGAGLKFVAPQVQPDLYTLHEVQLETGTVIHEYADVSGRVFAVTWEGPVLPDLSELLGDYFKTFKAETERLRHTGKRSASINLERNGLVVRSSGRMRHFFGSAYAQDLIPAGVNIIDVLP